MKRIFIIFAVAIVVTLSLTAESCWHNVGVKTGETSVEAVDTGRQIGEGLLEGIKSGIEDLRNQ